MAAHGSYVAGTMECQVDVNHAVDVANLPLGTLEFPPLPPLGHAQGVPRANGNGGDKKPQQKKYWANLFKDNRKTKLALSLDQYKAKRERLSFDYDDIDSVEDALGFYLAGCFTGPHPGIDGVKNIGAHWKIKHTYLLHINGWAVYRFDTKEDREKILQGELYFIFDIPIFLKIMSRCFLFNEECCFVPTWIQIHGLPSDCWTQKVLSMIGLEVGKPLYTDNLTRTRDQLEYARLFVEISTIGERVLGHCLDTCRRGDGSMRQQATWSGDNVQNGANEQRQWRPRGNEVAVKVQGVGVKRVIDQNVVQGVVDHTVEIQNVEVQDVVAQVEVQDVDQNGIKMLTKMGYNMLTKMGYKMWITLAYPDSLAEDVLGDFRLPISHRPTENLDTDNLEQASLDTQLTSSNVGFRLLQKMGWKGKGLGKNEQGITEPIKAGMRDPKLGVGKQEEDDFFTAEGNVQRRKLDVELAETEENIKKRERFKEMREMHGSSRDDRQKREQLRQEKEMAKFAQMYPIYFCFLTPPCTFI
ncbi:hypothetical protein ZIOFF_035040 [Zingiber officinale]|uniref:G-patch domain-containing protein n=1 Tax=Zingiber officinale TaxID=94328 RepID=A0A8J5GJM4_ZINOF|nr:hypothetical protein ZIOFF_035040 [Zingiber officinale]